MGRIKSSERELCFPFRPSRRFQGAFRHREQYVLGSTLSSSFLLLKCKVQTIDGMDGRIDGRRIQQNQEPICMYAYCVGVFGLFTETILLTATGT